MNIQDKIREAQDVVQKLTELRNTGREIDHTRNKLNMLIEGHDVLARELGEKTISATPRLKESDHDTLNESLLAACSEKAQPMSMLFDKHRADYTEGAIRGQVVSLVESGELHQMGDRGPGVRYIVTSVLRNKLGQSAVDNDETEST